MVNFPNSTVLYKKQIDDDGAIGKVAICLCEQCKVNGFLCKKSSRAISQHSSPKKGITTDGFYIVTEKMLQKIEFRDGVLLDELRSRPHSAQTSYSEVEK